MTYSTPHIDQEVRISASFGPYILNSASERRSDLSLNNIFGFLLNTVFTFIRSIPSLARFIFSLLAIIVSIFVLFILYKEINTDKLIIEFKYNNNNDYFKNINDNFSPAALAEKIRIIRNEASSEMSLVDLSIDEEDILPINIDSFDFSLREVRSLIRELLGRRDKIVTGRLICGDLQCNSKSIFLKYNVIDRVIHDIEPIMVSSDDLDSSLMLAALKISETVNPYITAFYQYRKGNLEESERIVLDNIDNEEFSHWLYNLLGLINFEKMDFNRAKYYFDKSISISNEQFDIVYINLGNLYKELGEVQKSILAYEKSLNINDDQYHAYYNLAIIYNQESKIDNVRRVIYRPDQNMLYAIKSKYYAKLALQQRPKSTEAHVVSAMASSKLGYHDHAINILDNLIMSDPYDWTLLFAQSVIYANAMKDYDKALSLLKNASKLPGAGSHVFGYLSLLQSTKGQCASAWNTWIVGVRRPGSLRLHINLGLSFFHTCMRISQGI